MVKMGKKEKKKIVELLRKLEESSSSENEEETPPTKRCRVMISSDSESSEEEQVHQVDQTIVEVHTEPSGQNTDKSKMNILGEDPTKSRQIGVEANPETAKRISHYCLLGIPETEKEKLKNDWTIPTNCGAFGPSELNPEVKILLDRNSEAKDQFMVNLQKELGGGLGEISLVLTELLERIDSQPPLQECVTKLMQAARRIGNVQRKLSLHRKHQILPLLKTEVQKEAKTPCSLERNSWTTAKMLNRLTDLQLA